MHTLPLPASQQMRGPDRGRRSPPQSRGLDRRYPAAGGQRYAGDRRRRSMSPRRSPVHYNNKRMRGPDGPYDQAYVFFALLLAWASRCSHIFSWNKATKKSHFAAGLGVMMTETSKQLMIAILLSSTDQHHQGLAALRLFQQTAVLFLHIHYCNSCRGPRQANGPQSYKAYMMELPDDITPEDAQKKYDEYLTRFWGSARKAYFQSIKDKSE